MNPVRDIEFMAEALRLAEKGLYTTHPNPRVGSVIVSDGRVVGRGFHRRAGEPHAEVVALAEAGEAARGATVYVTLEPCSHQGRTPPCADALIAAGVGRVVAAMVDPNPEVSGQGVERLRQAGIEVDVGVLEAQARALNPGYVRRISGGLPYVRCKLAMSLDGRAAMRDGTSKWITSEAARRDAQFLRARSDAILTGSGTLTYDDPSLNVRLAPEEFPCDLSAEEVPQPLRVVLDSNLKMNTSARMLSLPGKTLILCTRFDPSRAGKLERAGGQVIQLQDEKGRIYLKDALAYLGDRGLNEILIEAGPTVAGQALHEGVLDEIVIYVAPHLMGDDARGLFHLPWIEKMEDRIPLEIREIRQIGNDLRVIAAPRARGGN